MATRILLAMCLAWAAAPPTRAADRAAELEKLLADYEAAQAEFLARDFPPNASAAVAIDRYNSYACWTFLPKFLALAEADRTDAAALGASKWIVELTAQIGNQWQPLFDAEQTAWRIFQEQQLTEEEILQLSLTAALRQSPAREAFLRDMASRTDLPGHARAFARAALAEYLAQRFELAEAGGFEATWSPPLEAKEYFEYLRTQIDDLWIEYASAANPEPFRTESIWLFRKLLDRYADVPVNVERRYFRGFETLGQKARHSLYALEHLLVGAPAPDAEGRDLDGNPLRLSDYRGKVVLLSFWFPTCGPCIASVPEELELVEKFRSESFALLGICEDSDVAVSKQAAEKHGMTWPSWFDGKPGEITETFNVTHWPTFYLLDAEGRIASKDVPPGKLVSAVEAILHPQTPEAESSPRDAE